MNRFVQGFTENHQYELVEEINNYAENHNLNIIQVSYSQDSKSMARALVLYEKTDF